MQKRYVAMGDSITRGQGMPEGSLCWVDQVAARFPQLEVVNLSRSGSSSRDALAKLDDLRAQKPDIVTMQYGMNDHYLLADGCSNVAIPEFRENMHRLLDAAGTARVILITNHPIIEGDDGHYYFHRHPRAVYPVSANELIERYNQELRNIAVECGLVLIDMWNIASRYPREDFLRSAKNTPLPDGDDGVHPHLLGAEIYAQAVSEQIERILREL